MEELGTRQQAPSVSAVFSVLLCRFPGVFLKKNWPQGPARHREVLAEAAQVEPHNRDPPAVHRATGQPGGEPTPCLFNHFEGGIGMPKMLAVGRELRHQSASHTLLSRPLCRAVCAHFLSMISDFSVHCFSTLLVVQTSKQVDGPSPRIFTPIFKDFLKFFLNTFSLAEIVPHQICIVHLFGTMFLMIYSKRNLLHLGAQVAS